MINPVIKMDYPDIAVLRVDDTYYMVSTTMHFMPGCAILKSYDLCHWEMVGYVYDTLEDNDAHNLKNGQQIYGKGMWAPSFKYHKGVFYVSFAANDTQKTYLFKATSIEGPWEKSTIEGFYHDASLFFDDDDKIYIIYGNKTIYLKELKPDLSGPLEGGLSRIIVEDKDHPGLGYEGTHFYKIKGRYYAFFIHSLKDRWYRAQACFSAKNLKDEFVGGDVLVADMGHRNCGIAQGGVVDTPDGRWYAMLFQDRGAVGRSPVLVPMNWDGDRVVLGVKGEVPLEISVKSTNPLYRYEPLYASDDFDYDSSDDGKVQLEKVWQFNHNPQNELWTIVKNKKAFRITTGQLSSDLTGAQNTLTQRTLEVISSGQITVDGSNMKDGDYAGITALLGGYGMVAIHRKDNQYYLVMKAKPDGLKELLYEQIPIQWPIARLKCVVDYSGSEDFARFYYLEDYEWKAIGKPHKLVFRLDHFTGCRFGLFYYATKNAGGVCDFMDFVYNDETH